MRPLIPLVLSLILPLPLQAASSTPPAPAPGPVAQGGAGTSTVTAPGQNPYQIRSFDLAAMDRSADPCGDFYQFACGSWRAANPVPPDKVRWGRFNELAERNLYLLKDLLEEAAASQASSGYTRQVGDLYAACMDEPAVEARGLAPLQPELDRIARAADRTALIKSVAELHKLGVGALFTFGPSTDYHDSSMSMANLDQGGLTLPDRDYYLKEDARSQEVRARYLAYIQAMLELSGQSKDAAAAEARAIMEVETALARASMDRTARRDPRTRDHAMARKALKTLSPALDLEAFFAQAAPPRFKRVNVAAPSFFETLSKDWERLPLESWKAYVRWRLLDSYADWLPNAYVEERFRFAGQFLAGQQALEARWKRCTRLTDQKLGEAVGQLFVAKHFAPESRTRTLQMSLAVEGAMEKNLRGLAWMGEETRKSGLKKLSTVGNNVGYPEAWRDYSRVEISRQDLMASLRSATLFETKRQYAKIDKPVDVKEWGMTPATVNAYYRPSRNDINFPAGILQPPFFSPEVDEAVNYGAIGVVIGHELIHGFDDSGRKFDGQGNLQDWWTAADTKAFEERAACLESQYGEYVSVKDAQSEVKLNGKLTLGENVADNGGVALAYAAMQSALSEQDRRSIEGFTPEQRFFIGYAQVWCQNVTEAHARVLAVTDPHSPGRFRVQGVIANSPEFQKAFSCPASPVFRQPPCKVW